jgi:hypothetical protein
MIADKLSASDLGELCRASLSLEGLKVFQDSTSIYPNGEVGRFFEHLRNGMAQR